MDPRAYYTDFQPRRSVDRRAESNDCFGWSCLGDAAQFGIILVIVASVLALGFLYWRLKVKPNSQKDNHDHDNNPAPVTAHWEVTRTRPNRISITIYRDSVPLNDLESGEAEGQVQAPGRTNGDNGSSAQVGKPIANTAPKKVEPASMHPAPTQLGEPGPSNIHMLPPPPPPVFWAAAPFPSAIPAPPPFGPPTFLPPGHPTAPVHPNPYGFNTVSIPCAPDAPPPYPGGMAPPNIQGQDPRQGTAATAQSPFTPPPTTSSVPPRDRNNGATPTAPAAETQSPWRRWFSLGSRPPPVGHARTLSDSSSTASRSRSPSPRRPSASSSRPETRRRSPERSSGEMPRSSSARYPPAAKPPQYRDTQRQLYKDEPAYSESSLSSSYLNTSIEAVHDGQSPEGGFRRPARPSQSRERRTRPSTTRDNRRRGPTRIRPSDTVPLANLARQRNWRRTSPDLQYPSPEPRRVSFTLPRRSDAASLTSSSSSSTRTWEPERRSRTRSGHSRVDSRDDDGADRCRREQGGAKRGQAGAGGRVSDTFYRMRRALRGEN